MIIPSSKKSAQQQQPLQKSPLFLILLGLMALFFMLSLILHARLQDLSDDDDDMALGLRMTGGGDGLKNILKRQQQKFQKEFSASRYHKQKRQPKKHHNNMDHHEESSHKTISKQEDPNEKSDHNNNDGDDDLDRKQQQAISEKDDDNVPQGPILKFQRDQAEDQARRKQQGLTTVREALEEQRLDPDDWARIRASVRALRRPEARVVVPLPAVEADEEEENNAISRPPFYDIYNCPVEPPGEGYPFAWNVMTVLEHWNPDETTIPTHTRKHNGTSKTRSLSFHQSLCVFDWEVKEDRTKAFNYRQAQVPFVVQNLPEVLRTAERWSLPGYLEDLIGDEAVKNEHATNHHFMYWKTRHPQQKNDPFVPPTDMVDLTYPEWLEKARAIEDQPSLLHRRPHRRQQQMPRGQQQNETEHDEQPNWYYFRLNAMLHNHAYLYEELPFFDPTKGPSLTVVKVNEHRGINCRFGMTGVTAEAHYDGHNNFIALMGGQRRYILAHPSQCENMELYPIGHPSARHSRINWSNANYNWRDSERPFAKAQVNEVVLQAGDLLFLPTYWFHFIVSLNTNYQCNARSGDSKVYESFISRCGFGPRREYDKK